MMLRAIIPGAVTPGGLYSLPAASMDSSPAHLLPMLMRME